MSPRIKGRTLARAQALQLLFQAEAVGRTVDDILDDSFALEEGPLDEHGERLARGASGLIPELDAVLAKRSEGWPPSRMPAVDRNLLRVALYEMLCCDDIDVSVAIDEAVELAKAYGTDESARFVNGVLGRVAADVASGIDVLAEAAAVDDEPSEEE